MIIATKSFKLSKTGIHAVIKGTLKVGDLLTKDFGDGKKLWKVVEILNGGLLRGRTQHLGRSLLPPDWVVMSRTKPSS